MKSTRWIMNVCGWHQRQDILNKAENLGANLSGVCVLQGVSYKTETLGIDLASTLTIESLIKS